MIGQYVSTPIRVVAERFDGTADGALTIIASFHLRGWFYVPGKRPLYGSLVGKRLAELAEPGSWFVKAPGRRVQVLRQGEFHRDYKLPEDRQRLAERVIHQAITLAKQGDYLTAGPQGPAILAHDVEQLLVRAAVNVIV